MILNITMKKSEIVVLAVASVTSVITFESYLEPK